MAENPDPAPATAENGIEPPAVIRGRRKNDELKIAVYDAMLAGLKLLARVMWRALNDKNGGGS